MRYRLALFGAALLASWFRPSPSAAVTEIRYEGWSIANTAIAVDTTLPVDSVTSVAVSFEGISTAADLDGGFRFAIAEKDPDENDVLLRFVVAPCSSYPPAGSPITIHANFAVYCDPAGRLHAYHLVSWEIHWCQYPQPGYCSSEGSRLAATPKVSEPEGFELVVLDENDQEGTVPTPEDLLHSIVSGPGQPFNLPNEDLPPSGAVGIYADPSGTLCSTTIQPLVPFRWYVVARLEGLLRCGATIFAFLVQGLPPGIYYSVTPNPHAFVTNGTLFEGGGIGIGFECERGPNDRLVLLTIDGISDVPHQNVVLNTVSAGPPGNPNPFTQYPWAHSCPFPGGDRRELVGSKFYVNASSAPACDPTVAVRETTWEKFKALYR